MGVKLHWGKTDVTGSGLHPVECAGINGTDSSGGGGGCGGGGTAADDGNDLTLKDLGSAKEFLALSDFINFSGHKFWIFEILTLWLLNK